MRKIQNVVSKRVGRNQTLCGEAEKVINAVLSVSECNIRNGDATMIKLLIGGSPVHFGAQQRKTLVGQCLAGDVEGAIRGLNKILRRGERA